MHYRNKIIILSISLFICSGIFISNGWGEETPIIDYLLNYVENSEHVFIRNEKEYSGRDAVKHFKKKYKYNKEKINTPEEFIRVVASKSGFSGKKYFVRVSDDQILACEEWMFGVLKEYREKMEKAPDAFLKKGP